MKLTNNIPILILKCDDSCVRLQHNLHNSFNALPNVIFKLMNCPVTFTNKNMVVLDEIMLVV